MGKRTILYSLLGLIGVGAIARTIFEPKDINPFVYGDTSRESKVADPIVYPLEAHIERTPFLPTKTNSGNRIVNGRVIPSNFTIVGNAEDIDSAILDYMLLMIPPQR